MSKIKYFNETFKDKTTNKFINEAKGLDQAIHQVGCFGVKDLRWLDAIEDELYQRGYESVLNKEYYKK